MKLQKLFFSVDLVDKKLAKRFCLSQDVWRRKKVKILYLDELYLKFKNTDHPNNVYSPETH